MKKGLLAIVILSGVAAWMGSVALGRLNEPFRGYAEPSQLVEIPSGASTRAIGERLIHAGVVRDQLAYRVALWRSGNARRLKAGEYRFDRPMTPREVLDK